MGGGRPGGDGARPGIVNPGDVIIRVTSTGICGLDLHLYEVLGPFTGEGDILGYEPMGVVQETGPEVKQVSPGDRVVPGLGPVRDMATRIAQHRGCRTIAIDLVPDRNRLSASARSTVRHGDRDAAGRQPPVTAGR
jgi:threonine dehydrogenase-like Zn-dependent dehydrogenase